MKRANLEPGKSNAKTHIPALDGFRGLAILLVLTCHISEHYSFSNEMLVNAKKIAFAGWTGVDLFFVLSGFLITGILCDSKESSYYFRNFYARRTVRIFPIYYVTLLVIFVILPISLPILEHLPAPLWQSARQQIGLYTQTRSNWVWYVSYFVDFMVAQKGFLMPAHFWTLAIEEHFYLVWPLLVYFLEMRTLVITSVGIIVGSLTLRALLIKSLSPVALYVLTPCRMDGLALGALIALLARKPGGLQRLAVAARFILPATALVWAGSMIHFNGWDQFGGFAQTIGYTITIFFYASLLVMALSVKWITSLFSWKVLRFFGKYSYGIYVYHVFVVFVFAPLFALGEYSRYSILHGLFPNITTTGQRNLWLWFDGATYLLIAVGGTVLVALLSWYALEQPCLRLKRYFGGRATPVVLVGPDGTQQAMVNLDGITPEQYRQVSDFLGVALERRKQEVHVGVAEAMQRAIELCPKSNPADLWVHLIYHQFRNRYKRNDQSWKKVSGQALQHLIMSVYNPRLNPEGIKIRFSSLSDAKALGLEQDGPSGSNAHLVLETGSANDARAFGVLHVISGTAGGFSGEVPGNSPLIKNGYLRYAITLDGQIFPSPNGDGFVYEEIEKSNTAEKPQNVEVTGRFSGCYSFNLRTPARQANSSVGATICPLSFSEPQPDVLVKDILQGRKTFQSKHAM